MARTTRTREGAIDLEVPTAAPRPAGTSAKGPGSVAGGLFFNPAMRFSRDLSILVVEETLHRHRAGTVGDERPIRLYDGLAATGARALRLAAECRVPPGVRLEVQANDRDAAAVAILTKNAETNGLSDRLTVTQDDFALALGRRKRHVIDVDPYGSPAPFLDAAMRSLASPGLLALTATDTAALTGSAPAPCRRRYDAEPWHGAGMHDTALRILAGAAVRTAARHDVGLTPVLAHATDHYVRVYLTARRGARRADAALQHIAWLTAGGDGTRRFVPRREAVPGDTARIAGPLWGGSMQDDALIDALAARRGAHPQLEGASIDQFLALARLESGPALPIYEAAEISRALGGAAPRRDALIAALEAAGHAATRTHTTPTAVRTDAAWEALIAIAGGVAGVA